MVLTIQAKYTFTESAVAPIGYQTERDDFLDAMVQDGKTDGVLHIVTPQYVFTREFVDQNAAEEFTNFTDTLLIKYNLPSRTVTYEPIN